MNEANLKPWKAGQSGNPGGLSKRRRLEASLLAKAVALMAGDPTSQDLASAIAITKLLQGKTPAKQKPVKSTQRVIMTAGRKTTLSTRHISQV
jgi:hypothetical protein